MRPNKKKIILALAFLLLGIVAVFVLLYKPKVNPNLSHYFGEKLDSLNGVYVYYNGSVSNVEGRNRSETGYNFGLKYQCVEFVKRYYYQYYKHEMPDTYGNAKDFFDPSVKDGELNKSRGLVQYLNPGAFKPAAGDLIVIDGNSFNKYGHVAIISNVLENEVEIIQQNPGPFAASRIVIPLQNKDEKWHLENPKLLGWLRMKQ